MAVARPWRRDGMAMATGDGTDADELPARLRAMPTWLISQAETRAHRLLAERLGAEGARGYHFRLLAALAEFGPASQAALGRRTAMNRSDVVTAVNELVDQGLAERTGDPADRRRNIITMTRPGRPGSAGSTRSWRRFKTSCWRRCRPPSGPTSRSS